jgi:hypothetical protein
MDVIWKNIGFSWKGFVIFLLPMLPNILYFALPKRDGSETVLNKHLVLDLIEHGSQAIFIGLLILLVSKKVSEIKSIYVIGIAIVLISYYVCWVAYYTIGRSFIMLMAMAILPVVYFILAELWLHNYPAIVPTLVFGIVHSIITYIDSHSIQSFT